MFSTMFMGVSPKRHGSNPCNYSIPDCRHPDDVPKEAPVAMAGEPDLIDRIDLSMVKMKLCLPADKEGKGWTKEEANAAEVQYKRFLKLCILYPNEDIVPTHQIDEIWHQHILDTRAYSADCYAFLGGMLHHFPYFGLRDEQDAADLASSFRRTCELYEQHFYEPYGTETCGCNGGKGGSSRCSRK